ncbi:hypothetical protein Sango_2505200 [Sesamum angolense]|uniref:Reverse transcriptase zinc-binding domain-containing protein n=1 Tax=Sesamum angolense TaxID=2727404 RepID=A0AAE2BIA0_9LAMI|nr:hypothetical protein Sango_2505200 [Sesamum angolense]
MDGCPNTKVNWYWKNSEWDIDKLKHDTPQHVMELILQISFTLEQPDHMHWKLSHNSLFTTKLAWDYMRDHKPALNIFRKIWSPRIRPTISIFMWRLLNNWVPVENMLKQKGIPIVSRCCCCFSKEETITNNSTEHLQHLQKDLVPQD